MYYSLLYEYEYVLYSYTLTMSVNCTDEYKATVLIRGLAVTAT